VQSTTPSEKIQAIYNGEYALNYNARPCRSERKAAGERTMAKNNGNNEKYRE
jgi:hypothetical protein